MGLHQQQSETSTRSATLYLFFKVFASWFLRQKLQQKMTLPNQLMLKWFPLTNVLYDLYSLCVPTPLVYQQQSGSASRGFHPHNCWNKSSTHSNPDFSPVIPTKRASLFVQMFRTNAFGLYFGLPWPSFACDRLNDHNFHTHFCRASSQVQFVLHPPSTLQWEISVESPMHSWRSRHGRHSFKHWKRETYVKLLQPSAGHLTNGKDQVVQREIETGTVNCIWYLCILITWIPKSSPPWSASVLFRDRCLVPSPPQGCTHSVHGVQSWQSLPSLPQPNGGSEFLNSKNQVKFATNLETKSSNRDTQRF